MLSRAWAFGDFAMLACPPSGVWGSGFGVQFSRLQGSESKLWGLGKLQNAWGLPRASLLKTWLALSFASDTKHARARDLKRTFP